jgi:hypothetical protein
VAKFEDEEGRLNSLGNLLEAIGYSRDLWIDFADGAFDLLHKLAQSLRNMDGQAAEILLQTFNDMNVSMSIITFIKVSISPFFSLTEPTDEFSSSPAPGCRHMKTTLCTSSWATSRHTAPTTLSLPSAKPTTSVLLLLLKPL